jgi:hypothetical protein
VSNDAMRLDEATMLVRLGDGRAAGSYRRGRREQVVAAGRVDSLFTGTRSGGAPSNDATRLTMDGEYIRSRSSRRAHLERWGGRRWVECAVTFARSLPGKRR